MQQSIPSRDATPSWERPIAPWIGLAFAMLILGAALAYIQYSDFRAVDQRARGLLDYQVNIVDENLTKYLKTTGSALERIRADWRNIHGQPDGPRRLNARLEAIVASMLGVRTIVVVDVEGSVVASNRTELVGQNFRDSERYKTIRQGASTETLYLSPPFMTPLGNYAISAGKMVADKNGAFAGYVLAILDTEYFKLLMRSTLFSPEMNAALIHGDGKVILRLPDAEAITGKDLSQYPASLFARFLTMNQEHAVLEGPSEATGQDLLAVIHKVQPRATRADKPLVFAVSTTKQAMYARWRAESVARSTAFALISLAGILILLSYQRRQRAFDNLRTVREQEHRLAQEALLRAAESTQLAVDSSRLGVWHWFATENRIVWSDLCLAYFGLPPGTEITLERWADRLHPDDRARIADAVTRSIDSHSDYEEEYRVIWPDGSEHWLHAIGRPYFSEQGEVVRMEGTIQDITSRKAAEARLMERSRQIALLNIQLERRAFDAETAFRAKAAFMRAISHELRTPLNHILSGANILLRGPLNDKQEKWLKAIQGSSRELQRMISEVLDITYLAEGKLKLDMVEFAPAALLDQVRLMVSDRVERKAISLTTHLAPDTPDTLLGDPLRIEQAFYNLVDNATKFMESGCVDVGIAVVERDTHGAFVRFEVADSGIGIAPEALSVLLSDAQLFEQLDSTAARKFGGLGIGLAHVRELARLMGGQLGAESTPGHGSRFWFTARLRTSS